jgi:hypothetical protein
VAVVVICKDDDLNAIAPEVSHRFDANFVAIADHTVELAAIYRPMIITPPIGLAAALKS